MSSPSKIRFPPQELWDMQVESMPEFDRRLAAARIHCTGNVTALTTCLTEMTSTRPAVRHRRTLGG
jgi:hypothetical protein